MKWIVALVLVTGCMPYAIPPVTANVGATRSTERGTRTGVHVDAGLSPMQLVRGQVHRAWDATLSGSLDREHDNTWGVAVAGGPILHPWGRLDVERSARVLPQIVGRWTTRNRSIGVRLGVERVAFGAGSSRGGGQAGAGWGELGIGLYAEAARVRPHDEMDADYWMATFGVIVRVPAMAGMACCISP